MDFTKQFAFRHIHGRHFIDSMALDSSQVIFIATANTFDTINEPLLDHCEIIRLSGYSYDEKIHIARKFLLPK
jgi:ATP-dependent Lon protease